MKRSITSFLGALSLTLGLGCGAAGEIPEVPEAPAAVQSSAQPLDIITPPGGSGATYYCCDANGQNCYPAPSNHPWNCGPAPVIYACTTRGCTRY